MFIPVSTLPYTLLSPRAQALVIVASTEIRNEAQVRSRAAAMLVNDDVRIRDIVRDLLANPQIRAIVFDGACGCRATFDQFWRDGQGVERIDEEHRTLVRQFVDLYDDDFGHRVPQPPFWPMRIKYLE